MTNYDDVDFFNALELVDDPYPYFEYLRSKGPVVYLPRHNVVAVTGYDEGVDVLRDHELFSSINSATGPLPPLPFTPQGDDISEQIQQCRGEMAFGSMLVTQDPPEHTRSRSLVTGLLTPKRLKENEAFIEGTLDRLIDRFIERGQFEAVSEYAHPLATLTIADLLGVPEEDHKKFLSLFGPLPGQIGGDVELENNPMAEVGLHFYNYIEDRRREPREDVLTQLAHVKYRDGELPDLVEIVSHAAVLFGAGQDTTVRLIAAMLKTLGEKPDIQQQVRDDRSLVPEFVEEVLRLDGPTKAHFRLAKRHAKVGDLEVKPGTTVMLLQSAMRRDPRKFDAPNEFRFDRNSGQSQLAFGKGIHICIGSPLARTEAKMGLQRILDRLANIRVDENKHGTESDRRYNYEPNYTQRALCDLHLTFDAI